MFGDYICACFLIMVVSAIMLRCFNKAGYAFTLFDSVLLSALGIMAFTLPMGLAYMFASLIG